MKNTKDYQEIKDIIDQLKHDTHIDIEIIEIDVSNNIPLKDLGKAGFLLRFFYTILNYQKSQESTSQNESHTSKRLINFEKRYQEERKKE